MNIIVQVSFYFILFWISLISLSLNNYFLTRFVLSITPVFIWTIELINYLLYEFWYLIWFTDYKYWNLTWNLTVFLFRNNFVFIIILFFIELIFLFFSKTKVFLNKTDKQYLFSGLIIFFISLWCIVQRFFFS